jgi:hypothetical protein
VRICCWWPAVEIPRRQALVHGHGYFGLFEREIDVVLAEKLGVS